MQFILPSNMKNDLSGRCDPGNSGDDSYDSLAIILGQAVLDLALCWRGRA
jgi:hypothetical protein